MKVESADATRRRRSEHAADPVDGLSDDQCDSVHDGAWRCARKVLSRIKLLAVRRRFCLPVLFLAAVLVNVLLMIFWLPHKFEFLVLSDRSGEDTSFRRYTGYRMADMLTKGSVRWGLGGEQFYFRWFPRSIVAEYMRRTWQMENWPVLSEIVDERWRGDIERSNALLVHLRLGDVLERQYMLFRHYVINESFYEAYQAPGEAQVILFGNPWHQVATDVVPEQSLKYAHRVESIFRRKGLATALHLSDFNASNPEETAEEADKHLQLALSGSRLLISGGGFGRLLKRLAQYRGLPVDDPVNNAEGSIASSDVKAQVRNWIQKWIWTRQR
ncbi:unnamed protein product [Symbiodinium necroappetens]|uniref:Uncharacterized protein n=1 Tax=Symbiodinium necroappetens TaxID=1628268 RepID=A0A812WBY6_9DINO|nr:unnamed protein product [Symbiodinium necroappetens]